MYKTFTSKARLLLNASGAIAMALGSLTSGTAVAQGHGGWSSFGNGGNKGSSSSRSQSSPPSQRSQQPSPAPRAERPAPRPATNWSRPPQKANAPRPPSPSQLPVNQADRANPRYTGWKSVARPPNGRPQEANNDRGRPGQPGGGPSGNWQNNRPDERPSWKNRPDNRDYSGTRPGSDRGPGWQNRPDKDHDDRRPGSDKRPGWANDDRRWDRQHWRSDNRYDWRGYRNNHRSIYRARPYYAPYYGYAYRPINIGFSLGSLFYSNNYWIEDPWMYRLPPVYGPYRWVRYYDDVMLVDIYTGEVVDVIYGFFW